MQLKSINLVLVKLDYIPNKLNHLKKKVVLNIILRIWICHNFWKLPLWFFWDNWFLVDQDITVLAGPLFREILHLTTQITRKKSSIGKIVLLLLLLLLTDIRLRYVGKIALRARPWWSGNINKSMNISILLPGWNSSIITEGKQCTWPGTEYAVFFFCERNYTVFNI